MAGISTSYLTDILKRTGLFTDEQIETLLVTIRGGEANITDIVVKEGFAEEEPFLQAIGKVINIPFLRLGATDIPSDVLERLPTKAVFQYNVIPLSLDRGMLIVATNDPLNPGLMDVL